MNQLALDLRAIGWSTADLVRRLMREKHVVRSLLWPIALVPLTLMGTVLAFVWFEGSWPVAVDDDAPADVAPVLRDAGFDVVVLADARQAVVDGAFRSGTDGEHLWAGAIRGRTLQVERALRIRSGASWMAAAPATPVADQSQGSKVMGVIGVLFVLFGVVFGAGMVARDRDEGTLESELSMGVGRWVHGTARWFAGSFVLLGHYALAVLVLHAILGIEGAQALARNGIAACAGSVAIGLLVIGRGGLKAGFSGPLATGLSLAAGLVGVGAGLPAVGSWLPIASLLTESSGWGPLFGAAGLGAFAVTIFTVRSARA